MQETEKILTVDSPIDAWPNDAFDHVPTILEMRERAVLIMHRALSLQWFTEETIEVHTSISKKEFRPYVKYAGLPYTGPNTSIFGFLQFLDEKTGRLKVEELKKLGYPDISTALNMSGGSSCSGTVGWAIAAVCNSVRGKFQCYYMVPKNGWLPIGPYQYDTSVEEFGHDSPVSTDEITAMNGPEIMYRSYQCMEPGDIVVEQSRKKMGHTMMAIGPAIVSYQEDGTINGEKSYVVVQDQRNGGFQGVDDRTGAMYRFQGRVNCKYTFEMLFSEGYIPASTAEFQGMKPYEEPWVKASGQGNDSASTFDTLGSFFIESNYPIAHIALLAKDGSGNETVLRQYACTRGDVRDGIAHAFPLADFVKPYAERGALPEGTEEVFVRVTLPSGAQWIPVKTPVKKR